MPIQPLAELDQSTKDQMAVVFSTLLLHDAGEEVGPLAATLAVGHAADEQISLRLSVMTALPPDRERR